MRRLVSLCGALLWAGALGALPGVAGAGTTPGPAQINVQYGGGPLLQHVQVSTLFVGSWWNSDGSELHDYLNGFFKDLFADGRYMANLSQYSAPDGSYQIGNGALSDTSYTDPADMHKYPRVTDLQIQEEVRAALAAGSLPALSADSLTFVFTPPGVVVHTLTGDSAHDFAGYHTTTGDGHGGSVAYAVVPYTDYLDDNLPITPHVMTAVVSHELAEAVTDPDPPSGWRDPQFGGQGEIGDIPLTLYYADGSSLRAGDVWDHLQTPQGQSYLVQKEWSNKDGAPVAFAAAPASAAARQ